MRLTNCLVLLVGVASAEIISVDKEQASQLLRFKRSANQNPGKDFVDGFSNIGNGLGGAGKAVGKGIASGAKAVGQGIASGAKAVGQGIATGAKAVGTGVANAGKAVATNAQKKWEIVQKQIANLDAQGLDSPSDWDEFAESLHGNQIGKGGSESDMEKYEEQAENLETCVDRCKVWDFFKDIGDQSHEEKLEEYHHVVEELREDGQKPNLEKPQPCPHCCEKLPDQAKPLVLRWPKVATTCKQYIKKWAGFEGN